MTRLDFPLLLLLLAAATVLLGLSVVQDTQTEWRQYHAQYAKLVAAGGGKPLPAARIEQRIVTVNGREILDRCQTCHLGVANPGAKDFPPPLRTHPAVADEKGKLIAGHGVEKFSCVSCHAGNGRGLTAADAHGRREHWLQPLRVGKDIQASCANCHDTNTTDLPGAPVLARERHLFQTSACWACHLIEGVAEGKVGPILTAVGDRLAPAAIRHSIEDPQDGGRQPDSAMPKFELSAEQLDALRIFLTSQRRARIYGQKIPAALPRLAIAADTAATPEARGKALFATRGCNACHAVRISDDKVLGGQKCPELTYDGRMRGPKYIQEHLVQPKKDVPDTIMPPFDFLPEAEREALVAYLMDQKYVVQIAPDLPPAQRAEKQFEIYCASCHGEKGTGLGPVAAALDPKPKNFQKRPFVAAYGDRFETSIQKGIPGTAMPVWEKILSEKDVKGLVAYLRDEIARGKPRQYQRETVQAPAPAKDAFAAYLRGRKLFAEYCTGCHGRQGSGKGPNAYDLLAIGAVDQGQPQGQVLPRNLRNPLYYGKDGVLTRERVYASILLGAPGSAMPPWESLPARNVADLVEFVLQINNADFEKRAKESK